ncbi:MAG: calcium/sodium antiporter [Candidatus Thermoplasmatota archaeon]|nr:calcium/sodium antiporter [Candidatus Thermoplasmatota archaeon]
MIIGLLGTVIGLAMLIYGSSVLVDGAAGLAKKKGISGHVIGVTLVATATSLPELATAVTASLTKNSGIAIGNVVGSNAFNVGIVLALSVIIMPVISDRMVKRDGFFVWGATMLFALLALGGILRWEAFLLFMCYIGYVLYLYKSTEITGEIEVGSKSYGYLFFMLGVGFLLLLFGSPILVASATHLADSIGVTDSIIAVTLIAAGTSLPELLTAVIAAVKGHEGIAVGNVLGSNLFNILLIPGIAGLIRPLAVSELFAGAMIPAMMFITLLAVVLSWRKMGKFAGILLFIGFCLFMFLLYVDIGL